MPDAVIQLALDVDNKTIHARALDPTTGSEIAAFGTIKLVLGANPGGTPSNPGTNMGKEIKLRETKGCDDSGNTKYAIFLRSEWYDTALTSNPET